MTVRGSFSSAGLRSLPPFAVPASARKAPPGEGTPAGRCPRADCARAPIRTDRDAQEPCGATPPRERAHPAPCRSISVTRSLPCLGASSAPAPAERVCGRDPDTARREGGRPPDRLRRPIARATSRPATAASCVEENEDSLNVFIDRGSSHDRSYFDAHLRGPRSVLVVDDVRLRSDRGRRLSAEGLGVRRLPPAATWPTIGPASPRPSSSRSEGLTNFFRDAILAADQDPDLVWSGTTTSSSSCTPGSDWQNDVLQNTPCDLPTFSITLSRTRTVVVTDSIPPAPTRTLITTGIVFPETSNQDGFLVALNGAIAHEMGHQFDCSSTSTTSRRSLRPSRSTT